MTAKQPTDHDSASTMRQRQSWLGRYPSLLHPLLIVFAAAVLALGFVLLGCEAGAGDTLVIDLQVLQRAQALRAAHPWLAEVMRDLSGLGSTVVLTFFTVAGVGYLALVSKKTAALLLAISVVCATNLVDVLKVAFGRLRPAAAYAEQTAMGLSFPSGHTSMSAIVFLTLGSLLASSRSRLSERLYILLAATLLTALVGVSRVMLGVHYATDVLGGWAFGSAWVMVWLLLGRYLAKR